MNKNTGIRGAITDGTLVPSPRVCTTSTSGSLRGDEHRGTRQRPLQQQPWSQDGRGRWRALVRVPAQGTQRATQQRQPGAAVSAAKNGPAVMTVAGGHEQQSRRQPRSRPIRGSERTLSHGVKTTRPCSVPRTARACATAAPPTTRPVALTPRRDRRRLWQEKRATLRLRHNDRVSKGTPRRLISYPFPFFLFLSLATVTGKGGYPEKDPSP
jgi:hypothetical protein